MRIITGSAKGRILATFAGKNIRPTPDRVREAVFSMVMSRLGGLVELQVLDLFAGSGAMGLEALSRGAKSALFVDQGRQAGKLIAQNLASCRLQDCGRVLERSVSQALAELARSTKRFDLVFLDPPYAKGLVEPTLHGLVEGKLLTSDALVIAESDREDVQAEAVQGLEKIDSRCFGRTRIELYIPTVER